MEKIKIDVKKVFQMYNIDRANIWSILINTLAAKAVARTKADFVFLRTDQM